MNSHPIHEAANLADAIAGLLQRAAAVVPRPSERSEIRYAEALARTLADKLETMRRSRAA